MFHFPASTPTQAMHSPAGHHTSLWPGFPIRTSSDQRFVGNSPRHNAASHVLHRLSMPRHPPYALNNQTKLPNTNNTHHPPPKKQQAMRADTQNTYKRSCKHKTLAKHKKFNPHPTNMEHGKKKDARVHYTVLTQHTHTTTTTSKTHDRSRAGQQDNHNHTTKAWSLCAAPDTQQHANTLNNIVCRNWLHPRFATQAHFVLRVCIHPDFKQKRWQSHTRRLNHPVPQPWAQQNKSSLERR